MKRTNGFNMAALALSCLVLSGSDIPAATYYVTTTGSDANSGSSADPFRTLQKGASVAQAGDTVRVRAGVYYERIWIPRSGQPGQPITFEGERGAGGEWLTIIDGGTTTTSGWVPAPEVGSGVYKITSFPFEPGSMAVEEGGTVKDIPKIHKTSTAFTHLAKPADATEVTRYLGITVNFWDGIEALYYHTGSTLYVRFRNGDNPNSKTIRVGIDGWQGDLFTVRNKSYITIRNFQLQCSYRGIRLSQPDTHHVIVEGNRILATGRHKIYMEVDVHDIDVRNNVGYMSGLGSYVPGAWGNGTTYDHGVKEHIYWVYKVYLSDSSSSTQEDSGITLSAVNGANVRIHNNELYNSLSGISIGDDCSKTEVYSNTIHNISSGGFYVGRRSSAVIHDNLVYACNINVRLGSCDLVDSPPQEVYYYNNRSHNPQGIGSHTFFHVASSNTVLSSYAKYYFYHNSFSGGRSAYEPSGWADDTGALKGTRWINNILSARNLYQNGGRTLYDDPTMTEIFDYNWVGGSVYYYGYPPAWAGPDNIFEQGEHFWGQSSLPDFEDLSHDSRVVEGGIDLSQPFSIEGTTYPALPGMTLGYFTGTAPNMGAVQASGPPVDVTPPAGPGG